MKNLIRRGFIFKFYQSSVLMSTRGQTKKPVLPDFLKLLRVGVPNHILQGFQGSFEGRQKDYGQVGATGQNETNRTPLSPVNGAISKGLVYAGNIIMPGWYGIY